MYDNFDICYYCHNNILFNTHNANDFLDKYLYKYFNKKMILMGLRLYPRLKEYIDIAYYGVLHEKLHNICVPDKNMNIEYIYRTYFYQENLTKNSFEMCIYCNQYYCPLHVKIAPFKSFKCEDCDKHIAVCNECFHTKSKDIMCAFLHMF